MPGRTPPEAVQRFLEPIKAALACIARGQIVRGVPGEYLGREHTWIAGGVPGLELGRGLTFKAAMWYIVQPAEESTYRVHTTGYAYALEVDHLEAFALHWHPKPGPAVPHIHLGPRVRMSDGTLPAKHHLATPRMSFEQAIRWAIEFGVTPLCYDWRDKLDAAELPHLQFATWTQHPDVRHYEPRHRRDDTSGEPGRPGG